MQVMTLLVAVMLLLLSGCSNQPPPKPVMSEPVDVSREESEVIEGDDYIKLRIVNDEYTVTNIYYLTDDYCSEYSLEVTTYGGQSIGNLARDVPSLSKYEWMYEQSFYKTGHIPLEETLTRNDVLRTCYISLALLNNGG